MASLSDQESEFDDDEMQEEESQLEMTDLVLWKDAGGQDALEAAINAVKFFGYGARFFTAYFIRFQTKQAQAHCASCTVRTSLFKRVADSLSPPLLRLAGAHEAGAMRWLWVWNYPLNASAFLLSAHIVCVWSPAAQSLLK